MSAFGPGFMNRDDVIGRGIIVGNSNRKVIGTK